MALLDRDLRYVRINERLAAINGVPVEAHIGRLMWDVVPDLEIRKVAEPLYHHILETGEAVTTELEGETREQPGVIRQWIGHFYPLFDEQGEVVGIGAVVEEITERRRAESERARGRTTTRTDGGGTDSPGEEHAGNGSDHRHAHAV